MATCAACGRGFEPGDRRCRLCGRERGAPAPSAADLTAPARSPYAPPGGPLLEVVQPPSPWAAPAASLAPPPDPTPSGPVAAARAGAAAVVPGLRVPAIVAPATLADDGSLRVEVVDDEGDHGDEVVEFRGRDTHTDQRDVHVGRRMRRVRRVALAALAAAAVVAAGFTVVGRGGDDGMTVQLAGGTMAVTGDHVAAPTQRWTYEPADGSNVVMAVQDAGAVYVLSEVRGGGDALTVAALDAVTGTARWTYDVVAAGGTVHATPAGVIVNVQDDRSVSATMLAVGDGSVRWQLDGFVTQVPGSSAYGIVQQVNGRVALGLNVIDLATGNVRWSPAGTLRAGLGLDVLVDASCDAISGRSPGDGLVRWRYSSAEGDSFCGRSRPQVAVAADRIVVTEGDDLVGLDASGREQWRRPVGTRVLAGTNGPYVQLRQQDSVADQSYVDATTGADIDEAGFQLITGSNRDRTVLARSGDDTIVLLDEGATVVRADRGTAATVGTPMPGAGTVGLGRTTVYRADTTGTELAGFDLATGEQRWSVPLGPMGGAPRVWTADRLVVVGTAQGLAAFG